MPRLFSCLATGFIVLLLVVPGSRAQGQLQQKTSSSSREALVLPESSSKEDEEMNGFLPLGTDPQNKLFMPLARHLAHDQQQFWSSPFQLRKPATLKDVLPFAGLTAALIAGDRWLSKQTPSGSNTLQRSKSISNYAAFSLIGLAGGSYVLGSLRHNDHLAETGFLSGEAALNSAFVAYTLKQSLRRQRPYQSDGNGNFFHTGNSFPSEHAAIAWSVASVVAHEYPGPLTKVAVYGLASAVTLTRVTGKQHFPSDVLVGSALGWYFGRQVYRAHHDRELGGSAWGSIFEKSGDAPRSPAAMGSPYVPLDSWVYTALERLTALGYITTSYAGLKPWSRLECARLTDEAGEGLERDEAAPAELNRLQARLQEEFAYEYSLLGGGRNFTANLDSVYARAVSISGPALTDSYHFGQTLSYDFGRPFQRGINGQVGASFRFASGPFAAYVRAEFQHAPSAPAPSDAIRTIIAQRDIVPLPPSAPVKTIDRPRLLDAYVTVNLKGWQISAGKQNLSWGPGPGGSLLWSDNAEPITMMRLTKVEPLRLPSVLKFLGPAQVDQFIGRLDGHSFIPHPFIYGQKINFKPLPSLEIGFGRTVTLGGKGGDPFTVGNLVRSLFGQSGKDRVGGISVPGDAHSSMDWTFRVPKTRNYLVFYGEVYADDDFIPWQNPPKNPYRPGIYITRIPGIPNLDFHLEAASTESPGFDNFGKGINQGNLNYWNFQYHDGYTQNGNLIGNTVGRNGRAIQCWFTYWWSPRNTLQFAYKHNSVSSDFIPRGGAWQDYGLQNQMYLPSGLYLKTQVQYEHISRYPILFNGTQNNVTAIVEFGFGRSEKK